MTCSKCNIQYVGETTTPLNERISRHKSPWSRCQHVAGHTSETCISSKFSTQVLEKHAGTGYINNKRV